jgi:hypothetical protein
VNYLERAEPDVFHGRAAAMGHATGDVVALVEDHQRLDPMWAQALLDAWRAHPEADALVHGMEVLPDAGAWERTLFTMTAGPFLATDRLPLDRLPIPGIVSFRRSLLSGTGPEPGFVEYELLGELLADGRIVRVDVPSPLHVQPATWRAPLLAFHSARMYAGARAADAPSRRPEFRRLAREVPVVVSQTLAARRRTNRGAIGAQFAATFAVLVGAMVVGQTLAIVTRSTGDSARHLD